MQCKFSQRDFGTCFLPISMVPWVPTPIPKFPSEPGVSMQVQMHCHITHKKHEAVLEYHRGMGMLRWKNKKQRSFVSDGGSGHWASYRPACCCCKLLDFGVEPPDHPFHGFAALERESVTETESDRDTVSEWEWGTWNNKIQSKEVSEAAKISSFPGSIRDNVGE